MRASKSEDSKLNMCDSCRNSPAECEQKLIEFGDGFGDDNVVVCSSYMVKQGINQPGDIVLAPEFGVFKWS